MFFPCDTQNTAHWPLFLTFDEETLSLFLFIVQDYVNDVLNTNLDYYEEGSAYWSNILWAVVVNSVTKWRDSMSHSFNNLKMIFVYVHSTLFISNCPLCQVALRGWVCLLCETGSTSSLFINFPDEMQWYESIAKMECTKTSADNRFTLVIFVPELFLCSFSFNLSQNWNYMVSQYQIIHLWMSVVSLNAVALLYFDPFVDNL